MKKIMIPILLIVCAATLTAQTSVTKLKGNPNLLPRRQDQRYEQQYEYQRNTGCNSFSKEYYDSLSPAWVKHYGSYDNYTNTYYNSIAIDKQGDIYAFGSTEESFPRSWVPLRACYDNAGNLKWLNKNDNNSVDVIAFDSLGYIYGSGYDSIGGFITKLNPDWTEVWRINTYGAMVVDFGGNFYISRNIDDYTIATAKYNTEGVKQWETNCKWAGYYNNAIHIKTDSRGGAVILGQSYAPPNYPNPIVVKYAADGKIEWKVKYLGAVMHYWPYGLAIDDSGSVYISAPHGDHPAITAHTVKYNKAGVQQWVVTKLGFTRGLELDSKGNILLVMDDMKTIKFNSSGIQQWSNQYSSPGKNLSTMGLAIDLNDQVHLIGTSDSSGQSGFVVVNYNQQGNTNWVFNYPHDSSSSNLNNFKVKHNGETFFVGSNDHGEAILVKITSGGSQEWLAKYEGVKYPMDFASDLGIDSFHNIYVCGTNSGSRYYQPGYSLLKYDSFGNLIWTVRDKLTEISGKPILKITSAGDTYLLYSTFFMRNDTSFNSILLKSFDTNANLKWISEFKPPPNVWFSPVEILIDQVGNITTITGRGGLVETSSILLRKFSPAGVLVWSKQTENKQSFEKGSATLDSDGNIYIAVSQSDIADSVFILKYDLSGQQTKFASFLGNLYNNFKVKQGVDESGSIYVAGSSSKIDNNDFITMKFDKSGTKLWTSTYDGSAHADDNVTDLCFDQYGNIFVGGSITEKDWHDTFALVSYDSLGAQRWIVKENKGWENGNMSVDNLGNAYISYGGNDFYTCKYSNSGILIWKDQFSNCSDEWITELPVAMAVDGYNHLYVTGTLRQPGWHGSTSASMITTLQYDLTATSIENSLLTQPEKFVLEQNYPNPFNPTTKIRYSVPSDVKREMLNVVLNVYDVLGREVATLVNEEKDAGVYEVEFDGTNFSSGIYLYRLNTGNFSTVRKMILLK
jgi:hypothetical protein